MSENDKVIHLPSGDELRSCAECGCAVLDLDAHRRWHNRTEPNTPNAITPDIAAHKWIHRDR